MLREVYSIQRKSSRIRFISTPSERTEYQELHLREKLSEQCKEQLFELTREKATN